MSVGFLQFLQPGPHSWVVHCCPLLVAVIGCSVFTGIVPDECKDGCCATPVALRRSVPRLSWCRSPRCRTTRSTCTRPPVPRPDWIRVYAGDTEIVLQPPPRHADWHTFRALAGEYSFVMISLDHGGQRAVARGPLKLWVNPGDTWPPHNQHQHARPITGMVMIPLRAVTRYVTHPVDAQDSDSYGVTSSYIQRDSFRDFWLSLGGAPGSDTNPDVGRRTANAKYRSGGQRRVQWVVD